MLNEESPGLRHFPLIQHSAFLIQHSPTAPHPASPPGTGERREGLSFSFWLVQNHANSTSVIITAHTGTATGWKMPPIRNAPAVATASRNGQIDSPARSYR